MLKMMKYRTMLPISRSADRQKQLNIFLPEHCLLIDRLSMVVNQCAKAVGPIAK